MLAALLAGLFLSAPPKFDFYTEKPYDPSIPRPDATLGYGIGDRTTNFRDQERVLFSILNAAGKRVKMIEFGKSWEGRPLRVFVVSSPANMSRLEEIRKDNLARSRGLATAPNDPVIVWVNECIHGDETASFESGMALLYNLAASRNQDVETMLDKAVVVVNPCYNPDGHERYAVYYDSIATGSPEPGAFEDVEPPAIFGRLNHYRFDMNRDRVALSQAETRQEIAEFLRWHPEVYVDQHGQVETYFFPPNAMSQNVNVDRDRVTKWTDIFGRATGKAFDQHGWTYFVRDTFDLYYPGYLDSFTTLSGAIGMTHETDGGRLLARRRRDDTVVTLRDGAMKHFVSAMAVIQSASTHRSELLGSFVDFKKKAVTGEFAGKMRTIVVGADDPRALERLRAKLAIAGIESSLGSAPLDIRLAHDYWSGKGGPLSLKSPYLVVSMAQPQGQLAKALLESGSDFEPEFARAQLEKKKSAPEGETYPGPDGTEFYDTTAWSLPLAHDLRAWWTEEAVPIGGSSSVTDLPPYPGKSAVGYALPYSDDEDVLAVFEALREGLRGSVNSKSMVLGDAKVPAGTFLFLAARNEDGYDAKLAEIARRHGSRLTALSSSYPESGRQGPGSEGVLQLRSPKIGIVFGNGANMAQVGSCWYLMDQVFHLPFVPLSANTAGGDLGGYTCVVVPPGANLTFSQKMRDWVSAGGCLIALGGVNWLMGSSGAVELQSVSGDHQDLPGAIARAELDSRSFLSFGYGVGASGSIPIAVPVEGGDFLRARKEGGSVIKFSEDEKATKVLSGWSWPEDTEKMLAGAVWLQDVPVGRGHVILFTQDPTSRAMWPGLYKLFLNAMLMGPR